MGRPRHRKVSFKRSDDASLPTSICTTDHRWQWTRLKDSLAAGQIVGSSDEESKLMLVDVVPGEYAFQLQVHCGKKI